MYNYNDYRLYLEHSWGKKPEQKAAEKAYNQKYYEEHKSKWAEYRKNATNKLLNGAADRAAKGLEDAADMLFSIGGVTELMDLSKATDKFTTEKFNYDAALMRNQADRKYAQDVDKMNRKVMAEEKNPFFKDFHEKTYKEGHDRNWAAARESGRRVNASKVRQASDEYRKALNRYKSTPLGKVTTAMEGALDRITKKHNLR